MAVKNIKSIGGTKPIRGFMPIPPKFLPVWKMEVVTDTETIDVTDILVKGFYNEGVTNNIGNFEFTFLDPSNTLSNKVEEFDSFKVYLDYGATATTLRFSGKIEVISNKDNIFLTFTGRNLAIITTGINVIYNSDGPKSRKEILTDIIERYFSGIITINNIEDDDVKVERNYFEIPFWEVVNDLCASGGRDAYVDVNSDFNYFIKGSRQSDSEAIVETVNLIKADAFGKDTEKVFTESRVYGAIIDSIPIIATSNSDTTATKGIVKQLKIDNSSAINIEQASEQADAEFEARKVAPELGQVTSLILPTLNPGENLFVAAPTNNIPPAYYQVNNYKQEFIENGIPQTVIGIKEQRLKLSTVIKGNYEFQSLITTNNNPNDLSFSRIIQFISDSGIHSGTVINDNYLKVEEGGISGTWQSDLIELDSNPTSFEVRWTGENLSKDYATTTSNIWLSVNNGTTWTLIPSNGVPTSILVGKNVKIKIDLNSSDAKVKTIGVMYTL